MSMVAGPVLITRLDADGQPTGDVHEILSATVALSSVDGVYRTPETLVVTEPVSFEVRTDVDLMENRLLRRMFGLVLTARGRRLRRYRCQLARQTCQTTRRRNKHGRKGVRA